MEVLIVAVLAAQLVASNVLIWLLARAIWMRPADMRDIVKAKKQPTTVTVVDSLERPDR